VDDPAGGRALSRDTAPLVPDGLDAALVLVRHGESTFIAEGRFQGQAETPLTPTGLSQANLVAERLARPHDPPALPIPSGAPRELVHSPLQRTTQTAGAIEAAIAVDGPAVTRRPDAGFLEIGQGAWEGLDRDEIAARYGQELAAWRRTPLEAWAPGGESLSEVQARVRPAIAAILASLAAGRPPGTHDRAHVAGYADPLPDHPWTIVVGHDGIFKVAMLTIFDLPLDRFWMWSMDLCGITVIEFRAGRPVMRAHNLTAHLAALADADTLAALEERAAGGAL